MFFTQWDHVKQHISSKNKRPIQTVLGKLCKLVGMKMFLSYAKSGLMPNKTNTS